MKIAEILEIADKRTKGKWYVCDEDADGHLPIYTSGVPELDKDWNKTAKWIGTIAYDNGYRKKLENQHNAVYIQNAPEMELKLRLLSELLPEIRVAIQDAYGYRSNAISEKGKKWAAEYENLLTRLEELENE